MTTILDPLPLLSNTTGALSDLLQGLGKVDLGELTLSLSLLSERLGSLDGLDGDLNANRGALQQLLGSVPLEHTELLSLLDLLLDNHQFLAADQLLALRSLLRKSQNAT